MPPSAHPDFARVIHPAMPPGGPPDDQGSVWVGSCEWSLVEAAYAEERWELAEGRGYALARLLVCDGGVPRGFVTVGIAQHPETGQASIRAREVAERAALLPAVDSLPEAAYAGRVSVVISTRDRPDHLRVALRSVLDCADDDLEVVVVDNASSGPATREVVIAAGDPRVRLVAEPVPGLSRARNRGVLAATGDVIAFTDDDVVVDGQWIAGLRRGFAYAADIACVTGPAPAGELRTATQRWFESRVTWGRLLRRQVYRLASPPEDMPLFPFQVGVYGTGANMAFRRADYLRIGGLDEVLGVGRPPGGGEDLDMFLRILLSGAALVVEPSARVWHRHRSDTSDLDKQVVGYGRGLGAFLTKVVLTPRLLPMVARRIPAGLRRLTTLGETAGESADHACMTSTPLPPAGMARLMRKEFWALARGPLCYVASVCSARGNKS